jgi:hypothetical protein
MPTKRLLYLLRLIAKGETPSRAARFALMGRKLAGTREGRWVLTFRGADFLRAHGGDEYVSGYWPQDLDGGVT